MENFPEKTSKLKKYIKKLVIFLPLILIAVGIYFYTATNYIIIRFDELGPLTKNMAVYYNGFRIGKIVHIGPDKDFKHTLAKVNLTHKNMNLPQNTTVYVERFPNGELYLQFVYPKSPSLKTLKRGDVLEGIAPYSLEQFMLGQTISGMSDLVSLHIIKALNATDIANKEIQLFFKTTSKLIDDNRASLNEAAKNSAAMTKSLAEMAENLNQASEKLNNSLDEKTLKNTTINVEQTTANIAEATKDLDKTMEKVDKTMAEINSTAANLNSITGGLNQTLSKRFAGMRLLFGRPINPTN